MSIHFPNPIPADLAALDDRARRMSGTLRCDFANGRVGGRHDTFEHRSRLLRQLVARRDRAARPIVLPAVPE